MTSATSHQTLTRARPFPGAFSFTGSHCNPWFGKCKIVRNRGAGVSVESQSKGVFVDCLFQENETAGMYVEYRGNPRVWKCRFFDGKAPGLSVIGGSGKYEDNHFSGNQESEVLLKGADKQDGMRFAPIFRRNQLVYKPTTDDRHRTAEIAIAITLTGTGGGSECFVEHNFITGYRIGVATQGNQASPVFICCNQICMGDSHDNMIPLKVLLSSPSSPVLAFVVALTILALGPARPARGFPGFPLRPHPRPHPCRHRRPHPRPNPSLHPASPVSLALAPALTLTLPHPLPLPIPRSEPLVISGRSLSSVFPQVSLCHLCH